MDQLESCPKINTVNRLKKALLSQARLSPFNTNAVERQQKLQYNCDVMEMHEQ
jgi:hypothetical protein